MFLHHNTLYYNTLLLIYHFLYWTCTNPKARDFRCWEVGRSWKKEAITVDCSGNYHIKTPVGEGYTASLVEVVFYHKSSNPLILSTGTIVLPEQYDFPAYQSSKKLDEIRIEELLVFTVSPI